MSWILCWQIDINCSCLWLKLFVVDWKKSTLLYRHRFKLKANLAVLDLQTNAESHPAKWQEAGTLAVSWCDPDLYLLSFRMTLFYFQPQALDTSSRNLRRAFKYLASVRTGFLASAQNFLKHLWHDFCSVRSIVWPNFNPCTWNFRLSDVPLRAGYAVTLMSKQIRHRLMSIF